MDCASESEKVRAVVHPEVVVALKIVGDVQVRAPVAVQVARDNAQAIAVDSIANPGRLGHVGEMIGVVSEKVVARASGIGAALSLRLDRPLGVGAVVEQVHVEIAIPS